MIELEEFRSSEGADETVLRLNKTLKYHHITDIKITESELNNQKKKSKKKEEKSGKTYQVTAILKSDLTKINESKKRAGRFVLGTNRLDKSKFNSDEILIKYKEQQAAERGFSFLKDPLFFADSVFLKTPKRAECGIKIFNPVGLCFVIATNVLFCKLVKIEAVKMTTPKRLLTTSYRSIGNNDIKFIFPINNADIPLIAIFSPI